MTRVGRWMSESEYKKMLETGKVQMSDGGITHVTNPADINAFKAAKKGSIYVEFDVETNVINNGGKKEWGIISGPNSPIDKLNRKKGLPGIEKMPDAFNIEVKVKK
ncbi:TreTu family toxin [Fusobacterium necrophorum]